MKPEPNFILMNRRILRHEWLTKRSDHFAGWGVILMLTNYQTGIVDLTHAMHETREWFTPSSWRYFVSRLKKDDMIRVIKVENHGQDVGKKLLARVVNWGCYQGKNYDVANDVANDVAVSRQAQHKSSPNDVANDVANDVVYKELKERSSFQSTYASTSTTKSTTREGSWKLFEMLHERNDPKLHATRETHYQNLINKHGDTHITEAARITLRAMPAQPWAYFLAVIKNPDLGNHDPPPQHEPSPELQQSFKAVLEA